MTKEVSGLTVFPLPDIIGVKLEKKKGYADMTQTMLAIFGLPGGAEWIIILVIAVLIFGRRLPEIARGLGKSITEFKKGIKDTEDEVKNALDESDTIAEKHAEKKKDTPAD